MNELTSKKLLTLDSQEVAEMVGKKHKNLLRDIETYIQYLESSKLSSQDFFIKSTYISSQNKELPCYQITKKGCEMIANKLTGQKGVLFTATYINRFHEMEETITKQQKQITSLTKRKEIEARYNNSIARKAKLLEKIADKYKGVLSSESVQLLVSESVSTLTDGKVLLPKPEIEELFTAGEIAKELKTSANMIGRISNQNNLKRDKFGKWVLDKSPYSNKQVKTFMYNEAGRCKLVELYKA